MKYLFILIFFLFNCGSQVNNSFDSLSESFITWYYKNHPVESTMRNVQKYDSVYRKNDYKTTQIFGGSF